MTEQELRKFKKENEDRAIDLIKTLKWYQVIKAPNKASVLVEDVLPLVTSFIEKQRIRNGIKMKTREYFIQLNKDETGVHITCDENYEIDIRDIFIGAFGIAKVFFILNNKTNYISASCDGWEHIKITEVG